MIRISSVLVFTALFLYSTVSQTLQYSPKYEFRGVWITTVHGSTWPKSKDPHEQKLELLSMYERARANNLNAVVFQVRARGDAMYPSSFEPFSSSLTGTLGRAPNYDPLQYAIDEAHNFGLEFHAWWNVCKVADGDAPPPASSPMHVMLTHPEWIKRWKNKNGNGGSVEWWLDIGFPQVREWLIGIAMELVERYDIDAINFDYLRYPGPEFNDNDSYSQYGRSMSRDDWRRQNITQFLREFYSRAIVKKPMLKVGAAPIGIYKNLPEASGWQSYSMVYQDTREWLREGIVDYIIPQLYWELYTRPKFSVLVRDWAENSRGRHVYAGIGAFRPNIPEQIPAMIDSVRAIGALGECYFTFADVRDGDVFRNRYPRPALSPPMVWKDSVPPETPSGLHVAEVRPGTFELSWDAPAPAPDGDLPRRYAVYRSVTPMIDITSTANLVTVTMGPQTSFTDFIDMPTALRYFYRVTAFDKSNLESPPSNTASAEFEEAITMRKYFEARTLLAQNTPDPVERRSYISYQLESPSRAVLQLFNDKGALITTLVDEHQDAGKYVVPFYRLKNPPGLYRYTLTTDKETMSKYLTIR